MQESRFSSDATMVRVQSGTKREADGPIDDGPSKRSAVGPDLPKQVPTQAEPNGRICFPWLNHGACSRGAYCNFRHLDQDHPDAIADRVRTGHVGKLVGRLPTEQVRAGTS